MNYLQLTVQQLKQVTSCMPSKDVRYYLNGLNVWHDSEGKARVCATDGHRLNMRTQKGFDNRQATQSNGRIVPASLIRHAILGTKARDVLSFEIEGETVTVKNPDGVTLSSKLIEGRYPNIDPLLEFDGTATDLVFSYEDMRELLTRSKIKTPKAQNVLFYPTNDAYIIEISECDRKCSLETVVYRRAIADGKSQFRGRFTLKYLTDLLSNRSKIGSLTLTLGRADGSTCHIVHRGDSESFTALMPCLDDYQNSVDSHTIIEEDLF